MSETSRPYNEIDDYIAAFSDEEHQEYVAAETALDLASMLYQIRQEQGVTQRHAAERAGLKQQAISRCFRISYRDQRHRQSHWQCGRNDFAFSRLRADQERVSFFGSAHLPLL
jgi:hypothetical protein